MQTINTVFRLMMLLVIAFMTTIFSVHAENNSKEQTKIPTQIIAFLKRMKSASGTFTQIGPDGVLSDGEFALKKPGKIYFKYNPPTPLRIIADGFWVAVEDTKLKTRDRYPISETPLSVLLSAKPDFSDSPYKINISENPVNYLVTAMDPQHPERGEITLAFSKGNNTQLSHWVVTDAQGLKTIVKLQNIQLNAPTKNELFFIPIDTGNTR